MSEKRKLKSVKFNFIMNLVRVLMTIIFPLITYPYASRILSSAGVGRASYVATIVSYFQLIASFGVNNYAITEGAKIRDDKRKLDKFVSEVFLINIIFTVISYSLFIVVFLIPKFDGYQNLLLISSASILLTTLGMEWLFELLEEYEYITIRSVIFQFVALMLLFVFVKDNDDVVWYVFLTVLSTTGYGLVTVFQSRKYVCFFRQKICWNDLKAHLKPMFYMFGVSIASVIYLNSDITMLGWMKGDSDAGIYTIASKTNQIICTLIKSLSTVILPRLSYYIENGKKDEYGALLQNAFRFMMMLIAPCMIGMLLISPEVIRLIGGDDFLSGATASRILAINLFFSPINGFVAYQIFMPKKKQKIIFWATFGGAIFNLLINLLLIPKWSFNGAAIATVLAEALVMVISIIMGHKMIPFKGMFHGVWKYWIATVPMIIFYFVLQNIEFSNYIIYMLVMILIGVATYGGMLLLLKDKLLIEECKSIKARIFRVKKD